MHQTKRFRMRSFLILAVTFLMLAFVVSASAETKASAKIGNKKYESLQDAVDAVKDGQTIRLLKAVRTDQSLTIRKNRTFTINLDGKAYRYTGDGAAIQCGKGTVTIKGANIKTPEKSGTSIQVTGLGNMRLESGSLVGSLKNAGTVVILNAAISGAAFPAIENIGTLSIEDGQFSGGTESLKNSGTCTIMGGTFGKGASSSIENSGNLTIKGGSFGNIHNTAILHIAEGTFNAPEGVVLENTKGITQIDSGIFNGQVLNHAEMTINGGSYRETQNGKAVVECAGGICTVSGGNFFSSLWIGIYVRKDAQAVFHGGYVSSGDGQYSIFSDAGTVTIFAVDTSGDIYYKYASAYE